MKYEFENISSINPENPDSFNGKVFLTFDIDWANNDVLMSTIDIIEKYNIKATFFVTHRTELLERMNKNKNIELAIHPNFNYLTNGDFRYGKNIDEVLAYYKEIVPDAISLRSHDIFQKSQLFNILPDFNIKYDCNLYVPITGGAVKPFSHSNNNIVRVPFIWEDGDHCRYNWGWSVDEYLSTESVKVFDFHPIHVFLNTEKIERYTESAKFHKNINKLNDFVNNSNHGIYNFLIDLIETVK